MKNKIVRTKIKRKRSFFRILLTILAIGLVLTIALIGMKEKLEKYALKELLIFSIEQTAYCVNQTNMTFEEFSDDFLRYKVEQLINKND